MTYSYAQKQAIIDLLATPTNWANRFDAAFYDNAMAERFHGKKTESKGTINVGGRFNAFAITTDLAQKLGMSQSEMVDAVKLLIARDFAIEPELKAVATRHHGYAAIQLRDAFEYEQFGDVEDLPIRWNDTTEFEGDFIATPNYFTVQATSKGVDIRLTFDDRESILSFGKVTKTALEMAKPIDNLDENANVSQVFHTLSHGHSTRDRANREVVYMVVHTRNAPTIANRLRASVLAHYGLKGQDFALMAIDKDMYLVASAADTVDRVASAKPRAFVPANA